MAKPGNIGIKRILNAFVFSWQGFKAAFKHEEAFRQEALVFLIAVPLALWLGSTGLEKALLIGAVLILMIVELLNSAIEAVVDRAGNDWNELAGRAKDMGSAAVLLATLNALLIWGFILFG